MAYPDKTLPVDFLKTCLAYDPTTGILTRLKRPHAGQVAGWLTDRKYRVIEIWRNGKRHRICAHRIAFALMTGRWPTHEIDHRDGDPSNNRWANLREATNAENHQNTKLPSNNTSGFMGVVFDASHPRNPWLTRIYVARRYSNVGRFATREEAYAAYLAAKAKLHLFQPMPRS